MLRSLRNLLLASTLIAALPAIGVACERGCLPRDPIVFQPDAYAAFLAEISVEPGVRVAINEGRLTYLSKYEIATAQHLSGVARRPRLRFWPPLRHKARSAGQRQANQALVYRTAVAFAVDPGYFVALAGRESRFDHLAKAPTSSATGLFQFTENTWLCVLRQYGEVQGVREAFVISRGWDGRCKTPTKQARWRLLALRYDPQLNATMAALHTQDNKLALSALLGRQPTATELYAFHFFGAREGQNFLSARPDAVGARVTPDAARSNRTLFYAKNGRPLLVFEVERGLASSFSAL